MYTVMRMTALPDQTDVARDIVTAISRIRPDANAEQRRRDGVVVCDISTHTSWQEHQVSIAQFLNACAAPIERATTQGMNVTFDVAIGPEDMTQNPYLCVHCDGKLMILLVEHHVELEFTVYGGDAVPSPANGREPGGIS